MSFRKICSAYPGSGKMAQLTSAEALVALSIYLVPITILALLFVPGSRPQQWVVDAWLGAPKWSHVVVIALALGVPLSVAVTSAWRIFQRQQQSPARFWLGYALYAFLFISFHWWMLANASEEDPLDAGPTLFGFGILLWLAVKHKRYTQGK